MIRVCKIWTVIAKAILIKKEAQEMMSDPKQVDGQAEDSVLVNMEARRFDDLP